MVVKICLKCIGFKKKFFYCIVVVDFCFLCDGCLIEIIGIYNLLFDLVEVKIDEEVILKWMYNGVKLFDIVCNFFSCEGIMEKFYN